eukprot:TRINITY_DN3874_c0_g1_i1.p1 TRINITY_DN3874_c0_g1~~TRINITY_DN3874_c0_g1_i1.p1  ORF type:complete len:566 (+),score=141.50 TRINITY_DN3874_c0_g1_i1:43-1740(+)
MEVDVPEKRKGAFEDCLDDDAIFTKFEKWLKRTHADQELLNQLYFYRDVYEWQSSNNNGFYAQVDDWSEAASDIIAKYLLATSSHPFLGMMLDEDSEITLDHNMFDPLTSHIYENLVVKFVAFQADCNIMVYASIQQGSIDTSYVPTEDSPSASRKKKKRVEKEEDLELKKHEIAFLEKLKDEAFVTDFGKFLAENVENGAVHVEFLQKVDAFHTKYSTGDMDNESRSVMVMEAVKLYEEFFLEPKIPLVVRSQPQKTLKTLLQPPSEPPSDEINGSMFYVAQLQALRFLYNDAYRLYKKKQQLDLVDKKGKKGTWIGTPRSGRKTAEPAAPAPPPHVLKREMFNIYPEGSPDNIFWDSLADEFWLPKFRIYMEKEFATENLNCWQDVQAFRKKYYSETGESISTPELHQDAKAIYEKYIMRGARELVNINARDSNALHKKFGETFPEGIDQNVFLAAQSEVFRVMTGNHYRPYKEREAAEEKAAAEAAAAAAAAEKENREKRRRRKKEKEAAAKAAKAADAAKASEATEAAKAPEAPKVEAPEAAAGAFDFSNFGSDLGDLGFK